jgi:hypothetical protein
VEASVPVLNKIIKSNKDEVSSISFLESDTNADLMMTDS